MPGLIICLSQFNHSKQIQMSLKKIITAFFFLVVATSCKQSKNPELIRQVINSTFDKPDSKVEINPVVVAEPYAIANWTQGEKARRALLKLQEGNWQLVSCGGKGMKTDPSLMQQGVPENIATELSQKLSIAEKDMSNVKVETFDNFGPNVNFTDTNSHHH